MIPLYIIQSVLFIAGTIFLILVSYESLRNIKVHGFYRFFVFEATLALVVLNIPWWFTNSFSFLQIISWVILSVSILYLLQSIYFIKKYGGLKKRENYTSNFEFENTIHLVKEGIYKYIRHPMYGSLLLLSLGTMLKHITLLTVLLALVSSVFLILTARTEEKENKKFFGSDYDEYIKRTKMFIPFII